MKRKLSHEENLAKKKKTQKDFSVSWSDIAKILIDRVPKQIVENGVQATSFEIIGALKNMRLVCRGWREALDESIIWTAADYFTGKREKKPFVIDALGRRQMKPFEWAMEHLSKEVPLTMNFFDFMSTLLGSWGMYYCSRRTKGPQPSWVVKDV